MQTWKTISRTAVFERGKYLTVEDHTVELPNGRTIAPWPWLITPDYVNMAAVTEDGRFLCFRQTKYAVPGDSLAVVGGYLEPGEDPLAAAKRELREETGYEASDWTFMGSYAVDGNRGAGVAHLFLAMNARRVTAIDADDLEEQELLSLTAEEVRSALAAGEFKCLPWSTTMALALLRLNR